MALKTEQILNKKTSRLSYNKFDAVPVFESFLNSTSDSLIITSVDTKIIDLSTRALSQFGLSKKDNLLGRDISTLFYEVDNNVLENFVSETINIGYNKTLDLKYIKPNGDLINGLISASIVYDDNDNANYILFFCKDADENETEKKQLETEEYIKQFNDLWGNSSLIVQLMDDVGNIVRVNDKWIETFGYKAESVIGKHMSEFICGSVNDFNRCTKVLKSEGEIRGCELEFIKKDGTKIDILLEGKQNCKNHEGHSLVTYILYDITSQRKKELEIKKNEENFKFLYDTITDAVFIWEQNLNGSPGKCLDINSVAYTMLDYTREELLEMTPIDLITEDNSVPSNSLDELSESDIYKTFLCKKDGNKIPVKINTLCTTQFGKAVYITVCKDVTEKKRVQHLSRLFHQSIENSGEAIAWISSDGAIKYVNKESSNMLGYSKEELLNLKTYDIDIDIPFEKFLDLWEHVKLNGSLAIETRFITKEGKVIPTEINTSFLKYGDDEYIIVSTRDITKRKLVEDSLKKSEAHKSLILNSLPLCFYIAEIEGLYGGMWVSEQIEKLTGFKPEDFIKDKSLWSNRLHPDDKKRVLTEFNNLNKTISLQIEYQWRIADGTYRWFYDSAVLTKNPKEGGSELVGSWLDITDRKNSEEAIIQSESKYKSIFDLSPEVIILMDNKGKILDINNRAAELMGFSVDEIIGLSIMEFMPLDFRSKTKVMKNFAMRMIGKEVDPYELTFVAKNGDKLNGIIRAKAIRNSEGKIYRNVVVISDITGLKSHERELILAKEKAERSSKLKSEFLAQMSHEIRTPINALVSFASLIEEQLSEHLDEDLESSFKIMHGAGSRIIRTVDLMLNMADLQSGSYEFRPTELELYNKVLVNLHNEMISDAKEKGLELALIRQSKNTVIRADEFSVFNIFKILIENAIKYTEEGRIEIILSRDSQNNVVVKVVDTGIGMSNDYLSDMFSPFSQEEQGYSRSYEGNGLGLALVKKYCELNNADISVKSEKGVGSIFKIVFKNIKHKENFN
jgi:PAS domain S-box-containing protein